MKTIVAIPLLFLLLTACSSKDKETQINSIDGPLLTKLVNDALSGSAESNTQLSGLINSNDSLPDKFNRLIVDSTVNMSGRKLFSVLLEYPNPVYNILAVYTDSLNLLLLDNSLNGNIVTKWEILSGKMYLVTSENFIVKDKLKLSRLSLYSTDNDRVDLVFRTFTRFENSGEVYNQHIENTTSIAILTRLTSNTNSSFNNKSDTFTFNEDGNEYLSTSDTFTKFVLSQINKADWPVKNAELKSSVNDDEMKDSDIESESSLDVGDDLDEFNISLNNDWEKPIKIKVINHLTSELEGIRYINERLGAQITIIKIPEESSSSQFIKHKFVRVSANNYNVRETELIKSGRNFIQFFEHSCSDKLYILLLQAPKYTYDKNKDLYNEITSSFNIVC